MKRAAFGLLAVNVTAAYLTAFLVLLYSPGPFTVERPLDFLKFIPFGTAIILNFWLPLFTASTLLVLLLGAAGAKASWFYASGGAVLGIGFAVAVDEGVFFGTWGPRLIGLATGAICGWIYWRIAFRSTKTPGAS